MIILKNKKLFPFFLGLIIYSTSHSDSFELQLVENDVKEFVINKNFQNDHIIYYRTSAGDNTYVCKTNQNGNPIFHVATQIPSELTVINVFSENDDVKFHVIGKNKKQFFVDLIIDDGGSDKKNINLFTLSKSEKILNILQMSDHTLLLTLPEDSTFIYLYKFDDQGLKFRKRIDLESKMILNEIEKFGLQDMSNRFNPMPMASANSPCKLYVFGNELVITLDKYDDKQYEFVHYYEKINLINNTYFSKMKIIPYDKKIYGTASAIYNHNLYFLTYFKNELFISVTNIEDERQLGEFKIFADMSFDSLATIYSKIYPKDKLSKTSTKVLDKKTFKKLINGHPKITVTEFGKSGVQIVIGSFIETSGGVLVPPVLPDPISVVVSTAIYAASSAIRESRQINGSEFYLCINFEDPAYLIPSIEQKTSFLQLANETIIEFKQKNKKGNTWLLNLNNEPYLILNNGKDPVFLIENFSF